MSDLSSACDNAFPSEVADWAEVMDRVSLGLAHEDRHREACIARGLSDSLRCEHERMRAEIDAYRRAAMRAAHLAG